MIPRRRFLAISAASLLCPSVAKSEHRWSGYALGAKVSVVLRGAIPNPDQIFGRVASDLHHIEALFSLYQAGSTLSKLNRDGRLSSPPQEVSALLDVADQAYHLTYGQFDPTVQAVWTALAEGRDPATARALVGWDKVTWDRREIRLAQGQSLTFNGVAQGFATDRIAALLRRHGLGEILINIGEHRALGGPFHLGLADPDEGPLTQLTLKDASVATSSAQGSLIAGQSHLLHPRQPRPPTWSTVSVLAETAGLADAASTGFAFLTRDAIEAVLESTPALHEVHLLSPQGRYQRLRA